MVDISTDPMGHRDHGDIAPDPASRSSSAAVLAEGDRVLVGRFLDGFGVDGSSDFDDWVVGVRDGVCRVIDGGDGAVDLQLSFEEVDAFAAMSFAVATPPELIASGRLDVSDMAAMARMGELIPPPGPDTVFRT